MRPQIPRCKRREDDKWHGLHQEQAGNVVERILTHKWETSGEQYAQVPGLYVLTQWPSGLAEGGIRTEECI